MNRRRKDIRRDAFAEAEKYKEVDVARGDAIREKNKELYDKRRPGASYRNPKIVPRETSCCLDKDRPLPESFKVCVDCPGPEKLTEAGSITEAGSDSTGGESKTEAG